MTLMTLLVRTVLRGTLAEWTLAGPDESCGFGTKLDDVGAMGETLAINVRRKGEGCVGRVALIDDDDGGKVIADVKCAIPPEVYWEVEASARQSGARRAAERVQ